MCFSSSSVMELGLGWSILNEDLSLWKWWKIVKLKCFVCLFALASKDIYYSQSCGTLIAEKPSVYGNYNNWQSVWAGGLWDCSIYRGICCYIHMKTWVQFLEPKQYKERTICLKLSSDRHKFTLVLLHTHIHARTYRRKREELLKLNNTLIYVKTKRLDQKGAVSNYGKWFYEEWLRGDSHSSWHGIALINAFPFFPSIGLLLVWPLTL